MVDYQKIADAERHYLTHGYDRILAPWITSRAANLSTKDLENPTSRELETVLGHLVASGEQSFVEMMFRDTLPVGRHFCTTPCFRDEQTINELRLNYFMKVELIHYLGKDIAGFNPGNVFRVLNDAMVFFSRYVDIEVRGFGNYSFDIFERGHGIELGSYGVRQFRGHTWIYGTGCAEPRLSIARHKSLSKSWGHDIENPRFQMFDPAAFLNSN